MPNTQMLTLNNGGPELNGKTLRVLVVDCGNWPLGWWRPELENTGWRIDYEWYATLAAARNRLVLPSRPRYHLVILQAEGFEDYGSDHSAKYTLGLIDELLAFDAKWYRSRIIVVGSVEPAYSSEFVERDIATASPRCSIDLAARLQGATVQP